MPHFAVPTLEVRVFIGFQKLAYGMFYLLKKFSNCVVGIFGKKLD